MPIAGQHTGQLTLCRSWKTYCGWSVGYGSSSRGARRVAEASTQGFWSSHHPAARKNIRRKTSTKQHMPKWTKRHLFPLGQLPEGQPTNAPASAPHPVTATRCSTIW
ncbi:hypothetical protein MRX96_029224 [Rhipicephalus microplus]